MIVVTGHGPRCGTSAMMRTLMAIGVPVFGRRWVPCDVPANNPEGFYDVWPPEDRESVRSLPEGCAVKIWPRWFPLVPRERVEAVVAMRRLDRDAQIGSALSAARRIGAVATRESVLAAIRDDERRIRAFAPGAPRIHIAMEELRDRPANVRTRLAGALAHHAPDARKESSCLSHSPAA